MTLVKRLQKGTALTHAELDGNFDHLMAEVAKVTNPSRPPGVSFSTAPGAPVVTNAGITETASVVNNNGTAVNIPSLAMPYALAAAGKKRKDAIVVDYLNATPTYVRIAGDEVLSTSAVPTPTIPANRLFVRYIDITDAAATALVSELTAVANALAGKLGKADAPLYFGSNTGSSLGFGGGWIGWNISRNETTGVWTAFTDGGVPPHNAATLLFMNIAGVSAGNIFKIIEIPTAGDGSTNQTFTDAQIAAMPDYLAGKADKDLSINTQTANYTLALTDRGGMVRMNVASANTLTIPPNTFPIGTQIPWSQPGAGQTTFVPGSGVTVTPTFGGGMKSSGPGAGGSLIQVELNKWELHGNTITT